MQQNQAKQHPEHPQQTKITPRVPSLSWTSLTQEIKHKGLEPTERYLHTATIAAGKLYVLGGADSKGTIKNNKLYVFDTANQKWSIIESFNNGQDINAHACTVFKDEIYFFGGNSNKQATNKVLKYGLSAKTWRELQPAANSHVPSPREQAVFTAISGSFIFLYGGIDISLEKLYEDAFLLKGDTWLSLAVINQLTQRIKMAHAVSNNRLFLFGGECPSEALPNFLDDLHQVHINDVLLEVTFREIQTAGRKPAKRAAHCMVGVPGDNLIVYGGQSLSAKGQAVALCDVWLFSIRELVWTEVVPLQGRLSARYEFTMSVHNNEIYIFGGFNESNMIVDGFIKLEYLQEKQQTFALCNQCVEQLQSASSKNKNKVLKEISISTGFSYNLALQVGFPFRAIQIIVDAVGLLGASELCISTTKTKRDIDLFVFQFDASTHISDQHFLDFQETNADQNQAKFIHQLKLGSFRLGKVFLYISADEHIRKVLLTSADGKFSPNNQEQYCHFSYIQNLERGDFLPANASHIRQNISNILKAFVDDPNVLLSRREKHILIIFEVNVFLTMEKTYYYQLINYSRPENDVRIYCNQKKGEFLQELSFAVSRNPQFSLRRYLGIANLSRRLSIRINSAEDEPIDCSSYLQILRTYQRARFVEDIECRLSSKYVDFCAIFKCRNDFRLQQNHGILIYCGNQLLDRFKCPFGELMASKFYRKRYKKSHFDRNLFEFVGVLYLSEKMGISRAQNRLKKQLEYSSILQELSRCLKSLNVQGGKLDGDLCRLYEMRFSLSREGSKRQKKQGLQ